MARKVLSIALLMLALASPVGAQPVPPTPMAATSCGARLSSLIPLDVGKLGMARSYLMLLAPFANAPRLAAGTITVYDAANRWDIPFHGAVVAADGQAPDPTPIVVRFAQPVRLDGGRLASLEGPNGGRCRPFSIPSTIAGQGAIPFVVRMVAAAGSAQVIDAPQPTPDVAPTCALPFVQSRVVNTAQLRPGVTQFPPRTGTVRILVWLDDTGKVLAANVLQPSGSKELDDASLGAATSSTYSPRIQNCRSIGDTYMFRVDFSDGT